MCLALLSENTDPEFCTIVSFFHSWNEGLLKVARVDTVPWERKRLSWKVFQRSLSSAATLKQAGCVLDRLLHIVTIAGSIYCDCQRAFCYRLTQLPFVVIYAYWWLFDRCGLFLCSLQYPLHTRNPWLCPSLLCIAFTQVFLLHVIAPSSWSQLLNTSQRWSWLNYNCWAQLLWSPFPPAMDCKGAFRRTG